LHTEEARVATLKNYDILDTAGEAAYDRLVSHIAGTFGVASALISFIDEDRQWYKARHGVDAASVPRSVSFCTHSLGTDDVTVIPDAGRHPLFRSNPFVTALSGIRFYAAAPIKALNRARIGTVCVFDPVERPAGMTEREKRQLSSFAAQVSEMLEARRMALRGRSRGIAGQRATLTRTAVIPAL